MVEDISHGAGCLAFEASRPAALKSLSRAGFSAPAAPNSASHRLDLRNILACAPRSPGPARPGNRIEVAAREFTGVGEPEYSSDRKSTRLNSSHAKISYAVFC